MFTDTDSLCYEIKTDNVYEDLVKDKVYLVIVIIQKIVCSFLIKR